MEDRYLLISDLDGTLLGDGEALEEFAAWYESHRHRLRLVYNSGRFVPSILDAIESTSLPQPDAIIGGIGTQIWCVASNGPFGHWRVDSDGFRPHRICSVLSRYEELDLQPAEYLSDYKISYYVQGAPETLIEDIRRRLLAASCQVELVYSSGRDLDVLPKGVNKGSAAAFLATHWSFSDERVFVSGDTGNDLAMFEQGFRGIVVANAHRELKRLNPASNFQAKCPHAAGVLEGVSHWLATHAKKAD